MGKKRRRMSSPKYAVKFATKFAKFRAAVARKSKLDFLNGCQLIIPRRTK